MKEKQHKDAPTTDKSFLGLIKSYSKTAFIIALILAFRASVFEPYKIPTGSMIPTMLIGDFIVVNKFKYGFKLPFSHLGDGMPTYLTGPYPVKRGDIIVFKFPHNTGTNYVKRVLGIPGDILEYKAGSLYINGEIQEKVPYDGTVIMRDMDEKYANRSFRFYKVKTGDKSHIIQIDDNIGDHDFVTAPRREIDRVIVNSDYQVVVPDGKFVVIGDNRSWSDDSRAWGFVPFENIKGSASMVWFSVNLPFNWPWENLDPKFAFRPWRIGTMLE